jgi:hypothetical protein
MATYEIGDYSARLIYQALAYWRDHEDPQDRPCLVELLELFAPPEPPTAAELAEALRAAAETLREEWPHSPAGNAALELLERYDATREG